METQYELNVEKLAKDIVRVHRDARLGKLTPFQRNSAIADINKEGKLLNMSVMEIGQAALDNQNKFEEELAKEEMGAA